MLDALSMNSDILIAGIIVILYVLCIGKYKLASLLALGFAAYKWCATSKEGEGCTSCSDSMSAEDFNDIILKELRRSEGGALGLPEDDNPKLPSAKKNALDKNAFFTSLYSDDAILPRQHPGMHTLNALK
jgi:hypothetical protein